MVTNLRHHNFRQELNEGSKFTVAKALTFSPAPVDSPHKWSVTRKAFPRHDVLTVMGPALDLLSLLLTWINYNLGVDK